VPSLSGFDLMMAPEITQRNLAATATENYMSGWNLAKEKLQQAQLFVRNDFIAALQSNNVMANQDERIYDTSIFNTDVSKGMAPAERGIVLFRSSKIRGKLRKLRITEVTIYPLTDVASTYLTVYDVVGNTEIASRYNVALVAGQENTFKLDYLVKGTHARVTLDNTAIELASAPVTCFEGCNGTLPNDCGYARGWDGTKDVRKGDGYGINVKFQCACDYEELLCGLAKTYIGEIIYLKARVLLLQEHQASNRFNNWIVYNTEKTEKALANVEAEYIGRWNTLMQGLPNILKAYRDDCITCNGARWVINL
jgi:hypothetical protein